MTNSYRRTWTTTLAIAIATLTGCATSADEDVEIATAPLETTEALEACAIEETAPGEVRSLTEASVEAAEAVSCEETEDPAGCAACEIARADEAPAYENDPAETEAALALALAEASNHSSSGTSNSFAGPFGMPTNVRQCIQDAWRENPINWVSRFSISACGWLRVDANLGARASALALCSVISVGGCAGLQALCTSLRPATTPCLTTADHPYSVCTAAHIRYCSG